MCKSEGIYHVCEEQDDMFDHEKSCPIYRHEHQMVCLIAFSETRPMLRLTGRWCQADWCCYVCVVGCPGRSHGGHRGRQGSGEIGVIPGQ